MKFALHTISLALLIGIALAAIPAVDKTKFRIVQVDENTIRFRRITARLAHNLDGDITGFIVNSVLREISDEGDTRTFNRNALTFAFDGRDRAVLNRRRPRVAFASRSSTGEVDLSEDENLARSSNAFAMYIRLFEIVQYIDGNENGAFDEGEADPDTEPFELNTLNYECDHDNFTVTAGEEDTRVHIFTCSSQAEGAIPAGVVTIRFTVTGVPLEYQGVNLVPDTLKVDLHIENFPYTSTAENVRLAVTALTVTGARQRELTSEGQQIAETDTGITGGIQWTRTCTDQDGETVDVGVTVFGEREGEGPNGGKWKAQLLAWSFMTDKPTAIYWDPEIGLFEPADTTRRILFIVVGAIVAVGVVGAAVFLIRRRSSATMAQKV